MQSERIDRVRQVGPALALILGPLIYMIGQLLQPDYQKSDATEQLPVLVEHNAQGITAMVICIFSLVLFVPAVLGVMRLLRNRGAWLGLVGGSLAIAGVVLYTGSLTAEGLAPFELAESGISEAERPGIESALQTLIDNEQGEGAIGAYIGIGWALLPLGWLLISIGLWRAQAAPRWVAIVIAIGALGWVIGVNHWIRAVDAAILLVGLGAIGFRMLRGPATTPTVSLSTSAPGVHPARS